MTEDTRACPFPPGTPLVAYLRHSPGDRQTIESQESHVREWLAAHHLPLVRVFIDKALSGTSTAGRDEFLLMVDLLREHRLQPSPQGVVLWSFSRFAREVKDAEYYKWTLRHEGYAVYSMTDQIPEGDLAPIFESFVHWKDAERSKEISRDAARGLRWLAEQGYSTGGFPPIGYRRSAPVEVGRRKNGEARLAYKWEIDPETEGRVKLAWQMKLAGASQGDIHRATSLCAGVRGYADFFANETYAGVRKCRDLRVPNAHPAYVTKEEFERVQALRQPVLRKGQVLTDSASHPARRKAGTGLLLTGILKCGYCGWSMVGNGNGEKAYYRCDWRHRAGRAVCPQSAIVAYAVHDAVCTWVASEVVTFERLREWRDEFNAAFSGSATLLAEHRLRLLNERGRLEKQIRKLVDAIERGGWASEIGERLEDRKREQAALDLELGELEARLLAGRVEVSDEVLRYLADHYAEALTTRNTAQARLLLQAIVRKVELFQEKLRLHYAPEALLDLLAQDTRQDKSVIWTVPPREFESLFWP